MQEDSNIATIERKPPVLKPVAKLAPQALVSEHAVHLKKEQQLRRNLSRYLILIVIGLCGYTFVLGHVETLNHIFSSAEYVTLALTFFFMASVIILTLKSGYRVDKFGITLKNWKCSLIESILFTIPLLAAATLAKWAIIQFMPGFHDQILFHFQAGLPVELRGTLEGGKLWLLSMLLYAVVGAPLQELISQGGVQSGLMLFMTGKNRNIIAILLTSLVFSTTHLALPLYVVALSFIVGLFWGWLFLRHRTLVGVTVSHILVGVWFFWILGVFT